MTLTVESWPIGESVAVSMCHYGEQNGDLMKDPDILFHVGKDGVIEYKEYQNDYAGFYSENHAETKEFMEKTWIPNLISQGHKLTSSEIEEDD